MHKGKLHIIKNKFKIIDVTANFMSFLSRFLSCTFVSLTMRSLDLNIVIIISSENMSISEKGNREKFIKSIRLKIHSLDSSNLHLKSSGCRLKAEPFELIGFKETSTKIGEYKMKLNRRMHDKTTR